MRQKHIISLPKFPRGTIIYGMPRMNLQDRIDALTQELESLDDELNQIVSDKKGYVFNKAESKRMDQINARKDDIDREFEELVGQNPSESRGRQSEPNEVCNIPKAPPAFGNHRDEKTIHCAASLTPGIGRKIGELFNSRDSCIFRRS